MGKQPTDQCSFLDIMGTRDFNYNGACAGSGEVQDLPDLVFYNTQNDRFIVFDGNNCKGFAVDKNGFKVDKLTPWQMNEYYFVILPYVVPLFIWPDCDENNTSFDSWTDLNFALGMPRGCSFSKKFKETIKNIRPNLYRGIEGDEAEESE